MRSAAKRAPSATWLAAFGASYKSWMFAHSRAPRPRRPLTAVTRTLAALQLRARPSHCNLLSILSKRFIRCIPVRQVNRIIFRTKCTGLDLPIEDNGRQQALTGTGLTWRGSKSKPFNLK
ncbi:hypothetical protein EVAR_55819_1 [Eumeta japonica]|uniref:Uncharacterized protein n=1 Tax=Eumeta variegata TaxID=151549 RepID=A0A4C1ZBY1_EUMVA|nr:hypothetical protein EVAR_55819_1 [Eumeta japonica]